MTKNFLNNLKEKKKAVILITVIVIALALVFSLLQPFQYRCTTRLLVIQKQIGAQDAYAAAKSAEKLAKNLSSMVYTSSFFNKVLESRYNIDRASFSKFEDKRRKQWEQKIETQVTPETGILKINVYDENKDQADQITQAIVYVLVTKGEEYHGGGEGVEIKTIDTPLVSKYPVKPNIPLNLLTGLILGLIAGVVFVFLSTKEKDALPMKVEEKLPMEVEERLPAEQEEKKTIEGEDNFPY